MWSSSRAAADAAADTDDVDDTPPDFDLDSDGTIAAHHSHNAGRLTRSEAAAIAAAEEARRPRRPFAATDRSGSGSGTSSGSSGHHSHGHSSHSNGNGSSDAGAPSPYVVGYGSGTPMNTPAPSTPGGKNKGWCGGCRRIGTACILLVLLAETLLVIFALGNRGAGTTGSAGTQPCVAGSANSGAGLPLASTPSSFGGAGASVQRLQAQLQVQQQLLLQHRLAQVGAPAPIPTDGLDPAAALARVTAPHRADLLGAQHLQVQQQASPQPAAADIDPVIKQMLSHKFDPTAAQAHIERAQREVNAEIALAMSQLGSLAPAPAPIPASARGPSAMPAPATPAAVGGTRVIPANMPVLADKLGTVQASRPMGPLLVTGSHRSGSSWLGATLNQAHPSLCYVDEPFHATHKAPASPFPRWFFYIPEWMRRTPTRFPADTNAPPAELDRLLSANSVTQPFGRTAESSGWPATKEAMVAAAAKANLNVPAGEDKALYFHPLADMDRVNAYLDASMRCQLKAAPKQYPLYIRLVKARLRKTSATIPLMKDPIALFSTPYLAKTYGVRPILLVRHPAAFIDSLVRPHWGFDWKDLTGQPWLMDDLLGPYADEIRAAERGDFPNRYTQPYASPQKSEFPGWLKFAGHALEPDPKAKPFAQPYKGKPLADIVKALEKDTTINAFTTSGQVRTEAGARGGWMRMKTQEESALYIRDAKHQDLIEAGILLWRVFYGVVARFRLEHPEWMVVRYEDLVRDRNTHFAKLFDYAGMPFGPDSRRRLAEMKFPRGIDHFRQTFTWQELAHIKHRTRDVWPQFYTDEDWFGADQPGAQRMEFVKK